MCVYVCTCVSVHMQMRVYLFACLRACMSMCRCLRVCLCIWMYMPYVCVCVCMWVRLCSRQEVQQVLGASAPLVPQVSLVALSGGMQGLRCKAWPAPPLSPPVLGHLFSCLVYRGAWRQGREAEASPEWKQISSGRNLRKVFKNYKIKKNSRKF